MLKVVSNASKFYGVIVNDLGDQKYWSTRALECLITDYSNSESLIYITYSRWLKENENENENAGKN